MKNNALSNFSKRLLFIVIGILSLGVLHFQHVAQEMLDVKMSEA